MATLKPFMQGGSGFGAKLIRADIQGALQRHAKKAKRALERPTQSWEHEVSAEIQAIGSEKREITVDDEAYLYLNEGTEAHQIAAVRAPSLGFQTSFTAKTVVGSLNSRTGGKFGTDMAYPLAVQHPGFEARHFDDLVIKEIEPGFVRDVEAAIERSTT